MVSLAELRRPEYALHWHEAVAVVAEVATMLLARGLSSVPAPESVILTPDGTLRFLDEGLPDPAPGRWLGDMLGVLLSSVSCPNELRRLVAESVADPPMYPTVAAFAEALAFFERPAREALLQTIAARASELSLQARANVELERLQTRARNQPEHATPRAVAAIRPEMRRFLMIAGGVVILVGMLAGAVLALFNTNPARATITDRVKARVDEIAQHGLEAIGLRTRNAPAPPAPAVLAATKPVSKPTRRRPRAEATTVSLKDLDCACVPPLPSLPAPELLGSNGHRGSIARDDTIYSADAEGVEPAVLTRPHLPTHPPSTIDAEEVGVLEIVVGPTGAVEHVRLISTANRYHERMLVAAAKAWLFEPATKIGRPVRYRTHIRVTL